MKKALFNFYRYFMFFAGIIAGFQKIRDKRMMILRVGTSTEPNLKKTSTLNKD